jgi:hypothetical protein
MVCRCWIGFAWFETCWLHGYRSFFHVVRSNECCSSLRRTATPDYATFVATARTLHGCPEAFQDPNNVRRFAAKASSVIAS